MSSVYTNYSQPSISKHDDISSSSPPTPTPPTPASSSSLHPPPPPTKKPWVEPALLPNATHQTLDYPDAREIKGNAPLRAKQLALNTFAAYGVSGFCCHDVSGLSGEGEVFGRSAGRKVRFIRIDVVGVGVRAEISRRGTSSSSSSEMGLGRRDGRNRINDGRGCGHGRDGGRDGSSVTSVTPPVSSSVNSANSVTAIAELRVDTSMVNGNGMMHGGCIAYLIDNCASIPLVVLGVLRNRNGVGVTQALNILFHSPAPLGTTLEIVSTSLTLGGRSMSSKCEIFDKSTNRLVASAFINKMEPRL